MTAFHEMMILYDDIISYSDDDGDYNDVDYVTNQVASTSLGGTEQTRPVTLVCEKSFLSFLDNSFLTNFR